MPIWRIPIRGWETARSVWRCMAATRQNAVLKVTSNGTISTLAGNGLNRFAGDGGLARGASLSHPSSVAVDVSGNVLIVDAGNGRIRKIDQNGIITTIAGGGGSG